MNTFLWRVVVAIVFVAIAILIARLIFPPPKQKDRSASYSLPPPTGDKLADSIANAASDHPEKSGIIPLISGMDAFASRIGLARAAVKSIDAQYYIWHDDLTGLLFLDELKKAADRGVRVRLLVDDNGTSDLDDELAALNQMDNFEVRIFNPFMLRSPRFLNYAFDFFRLNYRMHNKSFTVDGSATIIGGRNVGDEYFGTGKQPLFIDLDVLAIGSVVKDVSDDFDLYWNSESAFPLEAIFSSKATINQLEARVKALTATQHFDIYQDAIKQSKSVQQLTAQKISFGWSKTKLISDNPVKTLGKAEGQDLLINQMSENLGQPKASMSIVTPYFVPGENGLEAFETLRKQGVEVSVLTNSLAATDVAAVHSGYTKYRKQLLSAGVKLFELKPRFIEHEQRGPQMGFGSSGASLHAKTFSVDQKKAFVGSFNFDARSANLNTELGVLIENPKLAKEIAKLFENRLAEFSYKPVLNEENEINWVETDQAGQETIATTEPHSTALQRVMLLVLAYLPIEWLL